MEFDQFDNANRVKELEVGDVVDKNNYKSRTVNEKLTKLLNSTSIKNSCISIKAKVKNSNGVLAACDSIIKSFEQGRII